MKYIAYKTAQNDPNLPNGFITDHFETDEEVLDGYQVVTLDVFNTIFQNNVTLVRQAEAQRGVVTIHPNTPVNDPRPASTVEHVPDDYVPPQTQTVEQNAELFNQFLAWVAAGKPGSNGTPGNT